VAGHDDVDVLQGGQQGEDGDRHRGVARERAERMRTRVGYRRPEPSPQHAVEHEGGDRDGGRRAEVRAGHAEAHGGEQDARGESPGRLQDDAQPRRAVGARGLQEPALEAQEQPQAARDGHGGRRPFLVHVQERGERPARQDGGARDDHGRGEDSGAPARDRGGELAAGPEPPQRPLPSRGGLQGEPGHEQDHAEVQQRGERAVAVRAEHPREDHRADHRHGVRGHGRGGEADRADRGRPPAREHREHGNAGTGGAGSALRAMI
jgi:hypothetical protein